jgi:alkylmercury lyase
MSVAMNPEQVSDYLIQAFPEINGEQQQLSLSLYRALALGKPVVIEQLQASTGLTGEFIRQTLQSWPGVFFDDDNNVIGFWGITTREMPHRLAVNGHTSYAWCAWDTLFIPGLLDKTASVSSVCPVTGNRIELTVSPARADVADNKSLSVSFLMPDVNEFKNDVTSNFCHFVYFFDAQQVAEQWIAEHPGTFLLSIDDAFSIARNVNAARYKLVLN